MKIKKATGIDINLSNKILKRVKVDYSTRISLLYAIKVKKINPMISFLFVFNVTFKAQLKFGTKFTKVF